MDIIKELDDVDWTSAASINTASSRVLEHLGTNKDVLASWINAIPANEELFVMCESYDILDKMVLFRHAEVDYRIRLHVFLPGYFDRPHNHRWAYTTRILQGSYMHYLYAPERELDVDIDVASIEPFLIKKETQGATYTLTDTMVHAIVAEPFTVSLIVRGPATRSKFLVMDRVTNEAWWQYGRAEETDEEKNAKQMTRERFAFLQNKLAELDVI